jgi:putative membrane protein
MQRLMLSLFLAVTFGIAGCAKETETIDTAATTTGTDTAYSADTAATDTAPATAASPDQDFATRAAAAGLAEVELGNMARDKATSQQVKDFAQKMLTDHGTANDELRTVAAQKGMVLATNLGPDHVAVRDRLSALTGAGFDREYMTAMVQDHQKAVSEFENESINGTDPELKAWAAAKLPILREHLTMAQQISSSLAGQ